MSLQSPSVFSREALLYPFFAVILPFWGQALIPRNVISVKNSLLHYFVCGPEQWFSAHLRQKHLFSGVGYLVDKVTLLFLLKNSLLLHPGFKTLPLAEKFCISKWLHRRSESLDENNSLLLPFFSINYAVCAGAFYKACITSGSGFPGVH